MDAGAGLVDQVDRLVREVAAAHVARGEAGGGLERLGTVLHLVERLVARGEAAEDLDRLLDGGLLDAERLEAALERGVLLDRLAVLVERRRADALQLAAGERGLHDVRGVHRALGAAGADERVDLVDEEDDVARAARLVEHRLDALLELAAVLGAGDHEREVERDDAAAEQEVRDVPRGDGLREALDDGGLADARLADERGVVLVAAREDLDEALDLVLAPDHRVELLLGGEAREVAPERVERGRRDLAARAGAAARGRGAGAARRAGVRRRMELLERGNVVVVVLLGRNAAGGVQIRGRAAAESGAGRVVVVLVVVVLAGKRVAVERRADGLERLVVVDAEVGEHLRRGPLPLLEERQQEVLGADGAGIGAAGLGDGDLEDLLRARRVGQHPDLGGVGAGGGGVFLDGEADALGREPEAAGGLGHVALGEAGEPEQEVLGADGVLPEAVRLAVGDLDGLLGVGREEVERIHGGGVYHSPRPRATRAARSSCPRCAGRGGLVESTASFPTIQTMQFGLCENFNYLETARDAGFDYLEPFVNELEPLSRRPAGRRFLPPLPLGREDP